MTHQEREPATDGVSVVIPVYRDAARALELVHVLKRQRLPVGVPMDIVLVDDGSGDGSGERLEQALAGVEGVVSMSLPANGGRSAARNAGAGRARGTWIAFIDSDCLPANDGWLAAHLAAMHAGTVATTGPVTGNGRGFWHRYQSQASERRRRLHASGARYAGSSQNMVVRSDAFRACGGFDTAFATYGFEDRDVLLRLARQGELGWVEAAGVRHMDAISMRSVSRKMVEAGGAGAVLFGERHPDAYRALGYARLDARRKPWLRPIGRWVRPLLSPMAHATDVLLASRWWPYAAGRALVRSLTALSYLCGTAATRPAGQTGRKT